MNFLSAKLLSKQRYQAACVVNWRFHPPGQERPMVLSQLPQELRKDVKDDVDLVCVRTSGGATAKRTVAGELLMGCSTADILGLW